jgi:hypothetical protein
MKKTMVLLAALTVAGSAFAQVNVKDSDRIVIYGASNEYFGAWRNYGYKALFLQGLRTAGCKAYVYAGGHPGYHSSQQLKGKHIQTLLKQQRPTIFFYHLSTNDPGQEIQKKPGRTLEASRQNLNQIIDLIQAAGARPILMSTACPLRYRTKENQPVVDRYSQMVRDVAKARGVECLDHRAFTDKVQAENQDNPVSLFLPDNIHWSGFGYQFYAIELLKWAGVSDEVIAKIRPSWNRIPSMALYVNSAHMPEHLVTPDIYAALAAEAKKQNLTLQEYVDKILADKAATLQNQ